MADDKPIIIIKKKGGHGGHHGGAWKVAYADFVTAMMAFFMVMWLVNSAEVATRQNIASFFRKPGIFQSGSGTPLLIGASGILDDGIMPSPLGKKRKISGQGDSSLQKKSGTDDIPDQDGRITIRGEKGKGFIKGDENTHGFNISKSGDGGKATGEMGKEELDRVAEDIRKAIASSPELQELLGTVDVKVDADGLNIEIMDTSKTSMFSDGSARILPEAHAAFSTLGRIVAKLPNSIDVVGHTDSRPYSSRPGGYSNWELSADRANAARRILEEAGVKPDKFSSVLGRSDRELRNLGDPFDPANRRITLKMRFNANAILESARDPTALNEFRSDEAKYQELTRRQLESQKVRNPTTVEIVEGVKKKKVVKLPEAGGNKLDSKYFEKDKIFGDSPVLGPPDPFQSH